MVETDRFSRYNRAIDIHETETGLSVFYYIDMWDISHYNCERRQPCLSNLILRYMRKKTAKKELDKAIEYREDWIRRNGDGTK